MNAVPSPAKATDTGSARPPIAVVSANPTCMVAFCAADRAAGRSAAEAGPSFWVSPSDEATSATVASTTA